MLNVGKKEIKKALNKIIRDKGRFPTLQEMCNVLNYSENQTRKYMEVLHRDGYVVQNGDWYKFAEENTGLNADFNNPLHVKSAVQEVFEELSAMPEKTFKEEIEKYKDGDKAEVIAETLIDMPVPDLEAIIKEETKEKIYQPVSEKEQVEAIPFTPYDGNSYIYEKHSELPKYKFSKIPSDKLIDKQVQNGEKDYDETEPLSNDYIDLNNRTLDQTQAIKDKVKQKFEQFSKPYEVSYDFQIAIIRIVMAAIGLGSTVVSVYYTASWMLEFLPWTLAVLMSVIMVAFSVFAFETIILFMTGYVTKKNWTRILVAISFTVLWMIVAVFNMSSIIAGRYTKSLENVKVKSVEASNVSGLNWNIVQEKKTELKERINSYKIQIKKLDDESIDANIRQWRTRKMTESIEKLIVNLDKVRDEEKSILKNSKKDGLVLSKNKQAKAMPDFYEWMSGIFGIAEDKIQFFLSLIYGIFADFISPIAISLALFLKKVK